MKNENQIAKGVPIATALEAKRSRSGLFCISHFTFLILHSARRRRAGFTFIEMLVALSIALIIIAGVTSVVIQMMRDHETAMAYLDAVVNARSALRDMSSEIKRAALSPVDRYYVGVNIKGTTGDIIDNDKDGRVDEDRPDGRQTPDEGTVFTDQHVVIGPKIERPNWVGVADLGDAGVDSDPVFDSDALTLQYDVGTTGVARVSYYISSFEGEDHVLLRDYALMDAGTTVAVFSEPIAYNVLGLNFLYWNPNLSLPYWVESWDSTMAPFPGPGIELPASVYLQVTVYSGTRPLDTIPAGTPLETVTLVTLTNIESVIHDARYTAVRPTN
ncbi:MAG: prepilin-type N-terminal cleavage/methylation domain-containing protein [Candidatus Sumerlaeota bacterium]|nr:prepilin-type N-terminal cleavage/methylation domain-containing protein [Candidatus Sumerlaeota bacterium]